MQLSQLLENVNIISNTAQMQSQVSTVTDDSRKVTVGSVFVCIQGNNFDGHTKAAQALSQGAVAVVTERDLGIDNQIVTDNTRAAYALMCSSLFGNPERQLKIIGVTGTNGKTTTCFLIHDILTRMGYSCGLIGTVKTVIGDEEIEATLTTPDPIQLYEYFRKMVDAGCEYCVMEASSQALAQRRLQGVRFSSAIFTNLTQDHLDYHGSFENYIAAKHMLFENTDLAVINLDDAAANKMIEGVSCPVVSFSIKNDKADFAAKNPNIKSTGAEYELVSKNFIKRIRFKVPGEFSVYNSMGAVVCLARMGLPIDEIVEAVALFNSVPGRMEVVPTDTDYTVIIDYAHTPDALENVIKTLQKITAGKTIVVFGCGGDRDSTKRPIMGKIAAENADMVIVTSDNPRTEDPEKIIDDIMAGTQKAKVPVYRIADRREAIERAMKKAKSGDFILLAGKGQETYQIIGHEKHHMDEREIVAGILNGKK
ncbi:MAG: UDP-N-acetylmuramoyl-L-alanyl-D-glutamate--2,6-diaminopimelate ligase [Clostridia bacterium]|nr:UDP-N-acetylmuramoyl-L-alanyl-D-glutamate--2,6-diaminopimelate ligase [Clostridia bacterium]